MELVGRSSQNALLVQMAMAHRSTQVSPAEQLHCATVVRKKSSYFRSLEGEDSTKVKNKQTRTKKNLMKQVPSTDVQEGSKQKQAKINLAKCRAP